MSLMKTKRASGALNYNPGTFDNYCTGKLQLLVLNSLNIEKVNKK